MKIQLQKKKNSGYVMVTVIVLGVIGLAFMAGSMDWAQQTSLITARNNEYFTTSYAAEAATERALTAVIYDFRAQGEGVVISKVDQYKTSVPNSSISSYWTNYQFNDGTASAPTGRLSVARTGVGSTIVLASPYAGLMSLSSTYQIVADAKNTSSRYQIPVGVGQEVNLGIIPIFQFAIFYEDDLEIRPGPDMTITGLVHGNADIYLSPGATLSFGGDVSASGNIITHKKAGDQQSEGGGTVTYQSGVKHATNAAQLNLPVGNGFTNGVHGIIDMPPVGEPGLSGIGTNRLYNQVDLIVLVSNTSVTVKSGVAVDNSATVVPPAQWTNFISTNVSFYNVREASSIRAVTVDVGKLRTWSVGANAMRSNTAFARNVSSIFVADLRTMNSTQQAGICLSNAAQLPPLGLTVATPDPAYTIGHYNVTTNGSTYDTGTTNTTHTLPASIMCDAINVLSTNWSPLRCGYTNSLSSGSRDASDTTVNAAFMAGIVETTNSGGSHFSGGVENFPRFLEDWSGNTFTYNGSMVEMFDSAIANSFWLTTGTSANSYNPPVRNWNFDKNFMIQGKQPPLTPMVKTVSVPRWVLLAPATTNF